MPFAGFCIELLEDFQLSTPNSDSQCVWKELVHLKFYFSGSRRRLQRIDWIAAKNNDLYYKSE